MTDTFRSTSVRPRGLWSALLFSEDSTERVTLTVLHKKQTEEEGKEKGKEKEEGKERKGKGKAGKKIREKEKVRERRKTRNEKKVRRTNGEGSSKATLGSRKHVAECRKGCFELREDTGLDFHLNLCDSQGLKQVPELQQWRHDKGI
eukprot:Skav215228  [mRNA]  locus=scaffold341:285092:285532:- [translate_table: standard]